MNLCLIAPLGLFLHLGLELELLLSPEELHHFLEQLHPIGVTRSRMLGVPRQQRPLQLVM
jgi:hypothetical protein